MKNYQKEYYGITVLGSLDKRKYRRCIECDKLFVTNNKDNQSTRCEKCQHKHWNEYNAMKQREYYKKKKSV
jgi:DNA-directed RNA polymerase subunit RPC12/RpoP